MLEYKNNRIHQDEYVQKIVKINRQEKFLGGKLPLFLWLKIKVEF